MTNVIHHHAKTLNSPHTQVVHIAGFGKHNFINRLVVFRPQNRISNGRFTELPDHQDLGFPFPPEEDGMQV